MSSKEERQAQLKKTKEDLLKIGRLNNKIDEKYQEREESNQRLRQRREASGADGRWHGRESPRDPSPKVSDLANSPPPSLSSNQSNESSVDVFTGNEFRRPASCPPKRPRDPEDIVEGVCETDLSDREDDSSTGESTDAPRHGVAGQEVEGSEKSVDGEGVGTQKQQRGREH